MILLVGPANSGKTKTLQSLAERTGSFYLNVNLELSRRLLEATERQRRLFAAQWLEEIIVDTNTDPVLLDNIELLFDRTLQLDPLRALQRIATNRTIIAAWNGDLDAGQLTYARPDHPDYRRYPTHDLLLVRTQA